MKEKIISKASDLFLKLGFKSVTMDDIAGEMCISKKTIYKYFCNKEVLVKESTAMVHKQVHDLIDTIVAKDFNSIHENFEIREMFRDMFKTNIDTSPIYQLKKHYPEIYQTVLTKEIDQCTQYFRANIEKGIREGLYRKDLNIAIYVKFYYTLIFHINETTVSETEAQKMELEALEYHTRAMATEKGIQELEKQLEKIII
ncbi:MULTISPECIES: TetR/AcrR family transcriptional regulator [Flavobacterium]|uniref:TetR family transcriptional regulator n=2 Tax=Flavobacterium TaxID=237 RepID=A0A6V6YQN1_9FLAO|nr:MULTISPECIES: TetR/AcrR family transcriptional regulator [Flavobacterium]CAD0001727.1 TetR family transcriptional regulator [Flavobacterium salmonis]CAD0001760.1 TetR family transcriptional regulator [Flavobacterium chungangense]